MSQTEVSFHLNIQEKKLQHYIKNNVYRILTSFSFKESPSNHPNCMKNVLNKRLITMVKMNAYIRYCHKKLIKIVRKLLAITNSNSQKSYILSLRTL